MTSFEAPSVPVAPPVASTVATPVHVSPQGNMQTVFTVIGDLQMTPENAQLYTSFIANYGQ
jgi:hypothetical protein